MKLVLVFLAIIFSGSLEASEKPQNQFYCLVEALYHEARGEPPEGILAVSNVILNRVKSKKYPNTICEVVYQQKVKGIYQFSYHQFPDIINKPINKKVWKKLEVIAKYSLRMSKKDVDTVKGSMYYHTHEVNPKWSRSEKLKKVTKLGNHIFYKRVK